MASWVCGTCHSLNAARHDTCYSCRSDRAYVEARQGADDPASWRSPPVTPARVEPTFLYAGVVSRGIALVIDGLLFAPYWALVWVLSLTRVSDHLLLGALAVAGPMIYLFVGWAEFGTTVGMRLLHISIVSAADGAPLGYLRAFKRMVTFVVLGLLVSPMVAITPILIDQRRRAFHDHVAGTVVIRPLGGRLVYPAPRSEVVAGEEALAPT